MVLILKTMIDRRKQDPNNKSILVNRNPSHVYLSIYLSVYLSIYLSLYIYIYIYIQVYMYETRIGVYYSHLHTYKLLKHNVVYIYIYVCKSYLGKGDMLTTQSSGL